MSQDEVKSGHRNVVTARLPEQQIQVHAPPPPLRSRFPWSLGILIAVPRRYNKQDQQTPQESLLLIRYGTISGSVS